MSVTFTSENNGFPLSLLSNSLVSEFTLKILALGLSDVEGLCL